MRFRAGVQNPACMLHLPPQWSAIVPRHAVQTLRLTPSRMRRGLDIILRRHLSGDAAA
jgi:hypothetical protein